MVNNDRSIPGRPTGLSSVEHAPPLGYAPAYRDGIPSPSYIHQPPTSGAARLAARTIAPRGGISLESARLREGRTHEVFVLEGEAYARVIVATPDGPDPAYKPHGYDKAKEEYRAARAAIKDVKPGPEADAAVQRLIAAKKEFEGLGAEIVPPFDPSSKEGEEYLAAQKQAEKTKKEWQDAEKAVENYKKGMGDNPTTEQKAELARLKEERKKTGQLAKKAQRRTWDAETNLTPEGRAFAKAEKRWKAANRQLAHAGYAHASKEVENYKKEIGATPTPEQRAKLYALEQKKKAAGAGIIKEPTVPTTPAAAVSNPQPHQPVVVVHPVVHRSQAQEAAVAAAHEEFVKAGKAYTDVMAATPYGPDPVDKPPGYDKAKEEYLAARETVKAAKPGPEADAAVKKLVDAEARFKEFGAEIVPPFDRNSKEGEEYLAAQQAARKTKKEWQDAEEAVADYKKGMGDNPTTEQKAELARLEGERKNTGKESKRAEDRAKAAETNLTPEGRAFAKAEAAWKKANRDNNPTVEERRAEANKQLQQQEANNGQKPKPKEEKCPVDQARLDAHAKTRADVAENALAKARRLQNEHPNTPEASKAKKEAGVQANKALAAHESAAASTKPRSSRRKLGTAGKLGLGLLVGAAASGLRSASAATSAPKPKAKDEKQSVTLLSRARAQVSEVREDLARRSQSFIAGVSTNVQQVGTNLRNNVRSSNDLARTATKNFTTVGTVLGFADAGQRMTRAVTESGLGWRDRVGIVLTGTGAALGGLLPVVGSTVSDFVEDHMKSNLSAHAKEAYEADTLVDIMENGDGSSDREFLANMNEKEWDRFMARHPNIASNLGGNGFENLGDRRFMTPGGFKSLLRKVAKWWGEEDFVL